MTDALELGRFRLGSLLGRGSFGTVWEAHDTQLDRRVALKVLHETDLADEEARRFVREGRAAARLSHPNIVALYDAGSESGEGSRHYLVSQMIDGTTLTQWMSFVDVAPRRAAELCRDVADAIAHAHQHDIVHRDLKPDNILVDLSGKPHVTDFGVALVGQERLTRTGIGPGTLAYMAPEQAMGRATAQSDVYSLGVVLYQLLTGRLPFAGDSVAAFVERLLTRDPPAPRTRNAAVPRDLETICLKCLEREPADRYGSARDLRDDLDRFLGGRTIRARRARPIDVALKWARRRTGMLVAALVVAMLLVALLSATTAIVWREQQQTLAQRRRAVDILRSSLNTMDAMLGTAAEAAGDDDPAARHVVEIQAALARDLVAGFVDDELLDPDVRHETGLAHLHLANLARSLDQREAEFESYRRAAAVLGKLVEDFPRVHAYRLELAQALFGFGQRLHAGDEYAAARSNFAAARDHFRLCLELDPDAHARNIVAWFLVSCPDRSFHDAGEAVTLARSALAEHPDRGGYWNTLGVALYRAGRFAESIEALGQSNRLAESTEYRELRHAANDYFIAMARCRMGQAEAAREAFDRAELAAARCEKSNLEMIRFRAEAAQVLEARDGN